MLDSSSNISGIGALSATSLNGTLQTAAQPNITSLGALSSLSVSASGTNGLISSILQPSLSSGSTCYMNIGRSISADMCGSIGYYYDSTNPSRKYLGLGTSININSLVVSNNGYVGIRQTQPSVSLDVYGDVNIQGNLTFTGASRSFSGLTTLALSSNLVANGITLGLGSSGSQSTANNNFQWWCSTLNTKQVNLYRASDSAGLVLASTCSSTSSNICYPLLNLVFSENATAISHNGASSVSQSLFQIDWKQSSISTWSSQTIKHMLDFGNSRNYKTGYPVALTLATTTDAFCINTLGSGANLSSGCLYLVSGSGSTAPNNIDKLLFATDTPYTNASYGTAGFTCNVICLSNRITHLMTEAPVGTCLYV